MRASGSSYQISDGNKELLVTHVVWRTQRLSLILLPIQEGRSPLGQRPNV